MTNPEDEDHSENVLEIGVGVGPATHGAARTVEEQLELAEKATAAKKPQSSGSSVPALAGGSLKDRLKLLEEQRRKDAQIKSYTTDASQVTRDFIHDRLSWLQKQQQEGSKSKSEKATISVEGGNLKDRLRLLEEQKKRDAERLTKGKYAATDESHIISNELIRDRLRRLEEQRKKDGSKAVSLATDVSLVTKDLIHERLKWIEEQKNKPSITAAEKEAIIVEGGKLQDRLQMLEEQREKDAQFLSYTTDESQVTRELILARLQELENQHQQDGKSTSYTTDESLVTREFILARLQELENQQQQDGKGPSYTTDESLVTNDFIQARLEELEKQRQQNAQSISYVTDPSQVTSDFVRDRMKWLEEQAKNNADMTPAEREAIVVEGGRLQDRLKQLEEQRAKDAAKLISYTTDLSQVTDDFIRDRVSWIEEQNKRNKDLPERAKDIISSDLVAERMMWLKESAAKANALPEKERLEVTRHMVAQRQAWLEEAKRKAAELPPKERVQVAQGLISERISWLYAQKDKTKELSNTERTKMTHDLIAERISWLAQQYAQNASEDIEMQINFLAEQQEIADQMTEDEQIVMANALLDEKMNDLEAQKEFTAEMTEEQQIEVTNLLIEDRQAWLEGDENLTKKQELESDGVDLSDENEAAMRAIAKSIAFWKQQKDTAPELSEAERAEITSFLILEHIEVLEQSLEEAEDKEAIEMQIMFLKEQNDDVENIDHMMMINALVDEKITELENQLVALV